MDDYNNTADPLGEADEDILTYTVSDERIEAAAGVERAQDTYTPMFFTLQCCFGPPDSSLIFRGLARFATDEDILTYTVCDEAIEAAGNGVMPLPAINHPMTVCASYCVC